MGTLPYIKNILDFGHALANPNALGASTAVWHPRKKDYVGMNPSEDFYQVATAGNFTAFVFNGVTYTLETAIDTATGTADIENAIVAEVSKFEKNVWVKVSYAGGNLTIRHIGDLRLSEVSLSDVGGGSSQSTSNLSNVQQISTLSLYDVFGQIGPLNFNGTNVSLANETYDWTGTPATDAATATQLGTDIATAFGTLGITLVGTPTVTANEATASYDISLVAYRQEHTVRATGQSKNFSEDQGDLIFIA